MKLFILASRSHRLWCVLGEVGLGAPTLTDASLLMDVPEALYWLPHPESEYGNLNADNTFSKLTIT